MNILASHKCGTSVMYVVLQAVVHYRPKRLIDLIVNHNYREIIDVQTIIVMSISYILSKEIPSETRLCKSIWCQVQCLNCHKPEYRCIISRVNNV